jgi:hypothetical protein
VQIVGEDEAHIGNFDASVCSAQAAQVVLVCNGNLNFPENAPMTINGDSAMIDFDAGTFKPPIYQPYQITKVTDTDVNFGLETSKTSIFGTIDRISGNLSMNVMKPEERKKIMGRSQRENACLDVSQVRSCETDVLTPFILRHRAKR